MIPRKAITYSQPSLWVLAHSREDFDICDCPIGSDVLDVGCGFGKNLERLRSRGISVEGVDPDPEALEYCRSLGFSAQSASAEDLPFTEACFDVVILDGVISYAYPSKALSAAFHVLRRGGELRLSTQGLGYALHVIFVRTGIGKLFGVRMMLSTLWHRLTGQRLGDTLCFSVHKIKILCREAGFQVDEMVEGRRYFGLPVFIYLRARKP